MLDKETFVSIKVMSRVSRSNQAKEIESFCLEPLIATDALCMCTTLIHTILSEGRYMHDFQSVRLQPPFSGLVISFNAHFAYFLGCNLRIGHPVQSKD